MDAIDRKLTEDGIEIASRPIMAVGEISKSYGLSIPLGRGTNLLPPDLEQNVPLSEAVERWYHDNYGDRLKEDPCPGKMVIDLDRDLYALRVPRLFGSVNFVVAREWLPKAGISRGPVTCNVIQLLDGMTPARAGRLSDNALGRVADAFEIAVPAAYTLECTEHKLMYAARGDVESAVSNLLTKGGRPNESKWASLQAAEKTLKAALQLAGEPVKRTHSLTQLAVDLSSTGLRFEAAAQISKIQCDPGIRYGEQTCTEAEALSAHRASLQLVNILRNAGAKFSGGFGGLARSA